MQRDIQIIYKFWNKKLGFLGLSFKEGTDDLRNSPAVTIIEALLGKGCDVSIYDKNINLSLLTGTNKEYIDSKIPHLASLMVNDSKKIIDSCDVIIINTKERDFIPMLEKIKDKKTIIDLVRLDENLINESNYIGINW
jgi:GDP-mannose 6-dehydrogenase